MGNIITVNKLTFRYKDRFIFDKFSLEIKTGEWVTIAGANGSGKSTLLKLLSGTLMSDSDINICDIKLNKDNLYEIRKQIGVIFTNIDNFFVTETVEDEIAFSLENLSCERKYIKKKVLEVANLLHINHLLSKSPNELSGGEKCKIAIACILVYNPKIIMLDETLAMIDKEEKENIINLLNELNKKGITIINVTHDLSESYYSNRLIIINNGEILLDGKPTGVMEYDRILNKIGIEIPFEIELSIKLKLYGLIDKIYTNVNEMIDDIWE